MNKIKIVNKKSELIIEIESSFVPAEGEYIWLDSSMENADSRKVIGRVIDVDKTRKRINITLVVE
ncbi:MULTISPECIES: hypothetical protein [unclassified Chryseobacterium]|uniref:hypothetical protein n=1 Tax=unclassified Chryseobacterium TaxID=2593645 RepID=UPI002853197F|nr:hypothetical protein [Chryseobacterium sp. CFS7]MDR4892297.1 hypothetical protein [Chryseobacterium sp. CFS7]